MATPTAAQALSDARYSVIADLGRGESVQRTASFLVMSGWEEADALKFVRLMKVALDARKVPPRPWEEQEEEAYPVQTVEASPAEEPAPSGEDEVAVHEPTEDERRAKQVRRVLDVSTRNMKIGAWWFVGGVVATALGYLAASEVGGRYLVFIGAIVYGSIRFLVGYGGYRKGEQQAKSLLSVPKLRE